MAKNEEYIVEFKEKYDLEECEENTSVVLVFKNGEEYHGIFKGFDGDDTIMLKSESEKPVTIGLPFGRLKFWGTKEIQH